MRFTNFEDSQISNDSKQLKKFVEEFFYKKSIIVKINQSDLEVLVDFEVVPRFEKLILNGKTDDNGSVWIESDKLRFSFRKNCISYFSDTPDRFDNIIKENDSHTDLIIQKFKEVVYDKTGYMLGYKGTKKLERAKK